MIHKIFFKPFFCSLVFVLIMSFCGCVPGPREEITRFNSLKLLKPRQYPDFVDRLERHELFTAIENSLTYYKRVSLRKKYQFGDDIFTAGHMIVSLEQLISFLEQAPSSKALEAFIEDRYLVYEAVGNEDEQVLFTGYFEPVYEGSLEPEEGYDYPLYTRPGDLLEIDLSLFSDKYLGHRRLVGRVNDAGKKLVPYYSRKQINGDNSFHLKGEPLAWLKSRVDRFFLEIQGSGRIQLETGEQIQVHYAGSNGNAYSSVGRYLINNNEILKEDMSMQAIRSWLDKNPHRMDEVLHYNESFVFFTIEENGPIGCLGVKVTPFRSIATDTRLFPKGALCFVQTRLPERDNLRLLKDWEPVSFFAMNQDTGGAIRGPARADLFCGSGEYAKFTAGYKNVYGKLYFLVLKPDQG